MSDIFPETTGHSASLEGVRNGGSGADHLRMLASLRIPPQEMSKAQQLLREWRPSLFAHLTDLKLPSYRGERGFRFDTYGYRVGDVVYANQYSDSISGVSGGGGGPDPTVAQFVLSGWIRFENPTHSFTVGPGRMCVRDTREPWRFWYGPGTVQRWIMVPRPLIISRLRTPSLLGAATVGASSSAEARTLISYLEMLKAQDQRALTPAGRRAIEECAAILLAGVVSGTPAAGRQESANVTCEAARQVIDRNLTKADLSPATIARSMGVSVRTLHRAFTAVDDSVMGYVRRRRTQEAHAELVRAGGTAKISEIAAKWNFSDSSHFIRQFKELYGETPAAYARGIRRGSME